MSKPNTKPGSTENLRQSRSTESLSSQAITFLESNLRSSTQNRHKTHWKNLAVDVNQRKLIPFL